ncbi:hypothetical protein ACFQ0G_31945 [Streptomyces chiangmaiensis]
MESVSDARDKTTYEGTFVGNFPALSVDRDGRTAALSDCSSLFTLGRGSLKPTSVVNLTGEKGAGFDTEGLFVDRDGTRLVTPCPEPCDVALRQPGRGRGTRPETSPTPERERARPGIVAEG